MVPVVACVAGRGRGAVYVAEWMEQTQGREVAVAQMQQEAKALALAEPAPARSAERRRGRGTEPDRASDEVYYRTKAAAVLWMLRSIVGDDALKRALQLYREDKMDSDPKEFQRVLERTSKRELGWFFDDWVYRDRGLPDLSIASVTPRAIDQIGNKGAGWLVAVEVRNDGGAVAEVPVTVRSGTLTATQRLRIPGRSSASTRIVFEGTPAEVLVNDGTVPRWSRRCISSRSLLIRSFFSGEGKSKSRSSAFGEG